MQARLQSQEEQIRLLRQQASPGSAGPILPPAVAPVVQTLEVGSRWEPLSKAKHEQHLRQVFKRLREQQLYDNFKKCEFWLPKVTFLGDIAGEDGIKVEAVRDWPRPRNALEVRSFLGLVGYYRWFVEGFLKIATPMIELTRRNLKFVWSDKCENSFQQLKRRLIIALVLSLPSEGGKFVVYCDVSRLGLGCVLMLNEKVIAY
ncbi:uncharacterized mitochondrial protein AtMg00860-like [Humulus lupulus]|uniref:uncharacterized mitochondrial protein AtMg00860-like n=1 Tax=Humulus lupulus TaxID=3486 RepID=UPI002B40F47B|nr:uncharacterized mitochondrial protein AtMg00860-like [Humulus lupulus]